MNVKRISLILLLSPLMALSAFAGEMSEDLHWYKVALGFSGVSQTQADAFLNPFKGPTEFRLNEKTAPWAGNYFPMIDGGIAQRWTEGTHPKEILNKKTFMELSEKARQKLSPVEKYDAFMGTYDFRTTQHEMIRRGPLREGVKLQAWEGFCNGVRCAGIMMPEPKFPVEVTNPEGVKITFQPADLKALAGASYFYTQDYAQIGGPTRQRRAQNQPNAAVFDMVLRYGLAEKNKAFIIDSHLGKEIWNETVVGYKRQMGEVRKLTPTEKINYPEAVQKVEVEFILETLGEVDIAESNKATKSKVADGSFLQTLDGAYTLYLDGDGKAIDGKWKPKKDTRGVDFAWFVGGKGADKHHAEKGGNPFMEFGVIRKLIKESVTPACGRLFL